MPLDDHARVLLERLNSIPSVPAAEQPIENVRMGYATLQQVGIGAVTPVATEDHRVFGPDGEIPIRLYRPAEASAAPPIVVFFHGGGWTLGSIDSHDGFCHRMCAATGALWVSVDYRLAPEHRFPAAADDAWAAFGAIAEHGDALGGDPTRLAVVGDSAGGNLAAVVAQRAAAQGPAVRLQGLLVPTLDMGMDTESYRDNAEGYLLSDQTMRWFRSNYIGDDGTHISDPTASPLRADDDVLRGVAPALIITAEFDPLRDEGEAYGRRLEAVGVPVTVSRYDGTIHEFLTLEAFCGPSATKAIDELSAALVTALR